MPPKKRQHIETYFWERGSDCGDSERSGDSEEDREEREDPDDAPQKLFDMLSAMYYESKISAMNLCLLAYWATAAGAKGVEKLAVKPNCRVSSYQKHLDSTLGFNKEDQRLYSLPTAMHRKSDAARTWRDLLCIVPHEALEREMDENAALLEDLPRRVEEETWSEAYRNHPVVRAHEGPRPVVPVALYVDGVSYSNSDTVIAFWIYNLLSGFRHLCLAIRKSCTCMCGCRMWCTLDPAWRFLDWSFRSMAGGEWPASRHDDTPWGERDRERAGRSGTAMHTKYAVVMIKGDWSEFVNSLGFPSWATTRRPCFKCNATSHTMHSYADAGPLGLPWQKNRAADYWTACDECEIEVEVRTEKQRKLLVSTLTYSHALKGRVLSRPLPDMQLERGDRLDPCAALRNIADLDQCPLPVTVAFWRKSRQTIATRRNPIFNPDTGILPEIVAVDALHTVNLGVMLTFCTHLSWAMFDANAWQCEGNAEDRLRSSVLLMRGELWRFYIEWDNSHPADKLTRVSKLVPEMFGTSTSRRLKTKAAETYGLLRFLVPLMVKMRSRVPQSNAWIAAGDALVSYTEVMKAGRWVQPSPQMLRARGNETSRVRHRALP